MPAGRPSKFKPEYCAQAERLCRLGALDVDLAEFFDVSEVTLNAWKKAHPEFLKSLKAGKAKADQEVADKLIERAMGARYYQDRDVKLKSVVYENGKKVSEEERVEVVRLQMTAPPDTPAIIFFLKNRRPDLWRDKQTVEHAADKDMPPVFTVKIDNS